MSNKQIEEMAKALTSYEYKLCERLPKDKCLLMSAIHSQVSCDYCKIAEFLIGNGYRKASDVAREIFEDIFYHTYYSHGRLIIEHSTLLALQKKYTEGK